MKNIQLKAHGKINLCLDVLRKREDGYHDLEMVMQTVGLHDVIGITAAEGTGEITVVSDSAFIPNDKNNLCYAAASLLMDEFNIKDDITIRIEKNIPVAGGMAGGSSDCAAVLRGINEMYDLGLDLEELQKRGVTLGADVPFCLLGGTALAEGIGEKLTVLAPPPKCHILIAKPDIFVSTAYVFGNINPDKIMYHPNTRAMVKAIENSDLKNMTREMYNVMEEVTVMEYPEIAQIEQLMLDKGAMGAIMSGSGPTVFGIFDDREKANMALYEIKKEQLAKQIEITEFVNGISF